MVRAFVFVTTAAGRSAAVREVVAPLAVVREAHVVAGRYDVVLDVAGEDVSDILETVSTDVAHLDDVTDTRTYVALD